MKIFLLSTGVNSKSMKIAIDDRKTQDAGSTVTHLEMFV